MSDDDKLIARYRSLPREEPPAALDAAILAASRRAVASRPLSQRWAGPVSIAAVLVLAVGVTLHMQHEQPGIETPFPDARVAEAPARAPAQAPAQEVRIPPPADNPDARARGKAAGNVVADLLAKKSVAPPSRIDVENERKDIAAPEAAVPASPQAPAPATVDEVRRVEPRAFAPALAEKPAADAVPSAPLAPPAAPRARMQVATPSITTSPVTVAPPPAPAAAAPSPPATGAPAASAIAPAPGAKADERERFSTGALARKEPDAQGVLVPEPAKRAALADSHEARPAAETRQATEVKRVDATQPAEAKPKLEYAPSTDPVAELERIAKLRADGRNVEADKALEDFRRRFPTYRIPPPVWERVKPR